jgi:hypothetical protein
MKRTYRNLVLRVVLSAPLALVIVAPAQANFWESLFGIQEKPAAAAAPESPRPAAQGPAKRPANSANGAESEKRRIAANLALKAAQAGKDPATLALQDNTLRRGDIVSGPNGLMVYMGGGPDSGDARFLAANDPNLERRQRDNLEGLKRPTGAPAAADSAGATQRAAAQPPAADPVAIERDGKTIRVVGAVPAIQ